MDDVIPWHGFGLLRFELYIIESARECGAHELVARESNKDI